MYLAKVVVHIVQRNGMVRGPLKPGFGLSGAVRRHITQRISWLMQKPERHAARGQEPGAGARLTLTRRNRSVRNQSDEEEAH